MNFRYPDPDSAYHEFTLGKSYIYLMSVSTMRGWSDLPSRTAPQIALYSLLFYGTMMYWHWEAMLISYLATRKIVLPFNNIPELVSLSQTNVYLIPGSSYEDAFKTSRDPDWMAAWDSRVSPYLDENRGTSSSEFVEKLVLDSSFAYYDNYFSVM